MDERKKQLLLEFGYEPMSDMIYKKGMVMEVLSDEETVEEMCTRLCKRHKTTGVPAPKQAGSPWRPSLPIHESYHVEPKIAAFFGVLDMLESSKDNLSKEEEKPVEEPKTTNGDKDDIEYDLETEQQYYAAEWIKNYQTPIIYRMTVSGKRVYFEMGENGRPILYDGVTNNIANGYCDTSGALEKWKSDMRLKGKDPDAFASLRADFGTCMHYMFGLYLTGVEIQQRSSWYRKMIKDSDLRISKYNKEIIMSDMIDELMEDVLSFAIFCRERNVKPVLIEKMLRSRRLKIASSVDAVVEMDSDPEVIETEVGTGEFYKTGERKGQEKMRKEKIKRCRRIFAVLDFKSNRKGNFYDDYAFQLEFYRRVIRENYGNVLEIEKIYNFAPCDPTSKTSKYKLKDQTDNPILDMATVVFLQGKKKFEKAGYKVVTRCGKLTLGEDFDVEKMMRVEKLEDYITRVMEEARRRD